MGSYRNRKRNRGKFNKPGGFHKKNKSALKKRPKITLRIKKRAFNKFSVSKVLVKKAIKYRCIRDKQTSKLYMLKDVPRVDGYRFFNIQKLKTGIEEITHHTALCKKAHKVIEKTGKVLYMESVRDNGFYTVIQFICKGCGKKFVLENSDNFTNSVRKDIDVRCVWGSMVTGGGQSSLNELLGTAGVPGIDTRKYSQIEHELGKLWKEVMEEEMIKAGKEEKKLAEEDDDFFQGVPAITVICDGGWSKRAHKHTYNAMAGVAVIFGAKTGKLLHIGIRNRLCYVCSKTGKEEVKKDHECFKNWEMSSQSMESDIILEGFLTCEEKYGVRYMRMIGDGDSSVYATIVKHVPIWGSHVEKLECANHATKCLRSNLEKLIAEKPYFKGKGKLTKNNIRKITSGVRCAIIMRSSEDNKNQAIKKLKLDIKNCARHVLGFHDFCSTDFCKYTEKAQDNINDEGDDNDECEDQDVINNQCEYWESATRSITFEEQAILRKGGKKNTENLEIYEELLKDIYIILNRLAEKSHRLIGNFTSNLAESWMHIRCKLDGGKTLNKCFKGSFYARCYGAALRSLFGPGWAPQVYEKLTKRIPDKVFIETYRKRIQKYKQSKKSSKKRENIEKRKKRKSQSLIDNSGKKAKMDYGENVLCDVNDISSMDLKNECEKYFRDNIVQVDINNIELVTRGQSGNIFWHQERKKRITSSNFGQIVKRSVSNNSPAIVKTMLYSTFKGNMYTIKGLKEEQNARTEYMNMKNQSNDKVNRIDVPGLVIDKENPFLAASSDGIVRCENGKDGLIEIKTLLQTKSTMIRETAKLDKSFCLTYNNGKYCLNRKHNYYYQVQGQMNIMEYEWCDFVIRRTNPFDLFVERIYVDKDLWTNTMLPKLKAFYHTHLLPELAAPRHHTTTGIRKPDIPWFEGKCSSKQVTARRKSCDVDESVPVLSPAGVTFSNPIASTSTGGYTEPLLRTRERKTKFVGRRIKHLWTETDGSSKWYKGTVLSVTGKDGEKNAVYQVQYDDESDAYDVESLISDLQDGTLKFIDV